MKQVTSRRHAHRHLPWATQPREALRLHVDMFWFSGQSTRRSSNLTRTLIKKNKKNLVSNAEKAIYWMSVTQTELEARLNTFRVKPPVVDEQSTRNVKRIPLYKINK